MRLLVQTKVDSETRVGLVDDSGKLWEYHRESQRARGTLVGNIYVGRVINIEPAIQAAFVDIGENRTAFLHFSDVHPAYDNGKRVSLLSFQESFPRKRGEGFIQDCLRSGQELVVQVSKDAIGQKGPSVSSYLSLPGRSLVLLSGVQRPGVSRKIEADLREPLRQLAEKLPEIPGAGIIIRTAGSDLKEEELAQEVSELSVEWQQLAKIADQQTAPARLRSEVDLLRKIARDLWTASIQEVVIDDEEKGQQLLVERKKWPCTGELKLDVYRGKSALFRHRGIENQIDGIYDRNVKLPSGGALVIEETEALVAIDVNSGTDLTARNLENTALQTNLEAAVEVARQIRLRDLGGVIVCDFIDMLEAEHRAQLEEAFREWTQEDRAKIWYAPLSRFGLLELTRQKLGPSKNRLGRTSCPTCNGRGTVREEHRLAPGLMKELTRGMAQDGVQEAVVTVAEGIYDRLRVDRAEEIEALEQQAGGRIILESEKDWSPECWAIRYR
ncbi:hypothetical protein CBD41_00595 [bacterium TMED181]|nr:hypothetical protein [Planctomycetota bacterium]OUW47632.1 MAG: hypothetical protein CBD41_00595 [bacterium TMED181]